jgi:hypothetical protein
MAYAEIDAQIPRNQLLETSRDSRIGLLLGLTGYTEVIGQLSSFSFADKPECKVRRFVASEKLG